MKIHHLLLAVLIFSCNPQQEFSKDDVLTIGQEFTSQFNSDKLTSLHDKFYHKNFTLQNLIDFKAKVDDELGVETEVVDEVIDNKIWENKQYYGYVRYSNYAKAPRSVKTIFAFDENKTIYRFEIMLIPEPVHSNFKNYITKTEIRLPIEGEWYVGAGGRSSMYNHHTVKSATRFAVDFIIKKDESFYKGTGRRNVDYYSFNQKVFAPGSGIIVEIVNNIKENKIGFKPQDNPGNRVTIDHGNGEFSFLCHFKKGSICVNPGDSVEIGQYLGLCGNSGFSYAPHIHYHMQNTTTIFSGDGLPIQFKSFYFDEEYVEIGEMEYGKQVKNKSQ